MTDASHSTDNDPEPTHLAPDLQEILLECFEVRGYTIEFRPGYFLATRDGKTDRIPNATVMQYVRAFNPTWEDD